MTVFESSPGAHVTGILSSFLEFMSGCVLALLDYARRGAGLGVGGASGLFTAPAIGSCVFHWFLEIILILK